ncbi:TIM-barrel domain-containing protein [Pseudoduganella namucuonensis]|uniref:Alpha-glucosidase/oligosaccharide 4-alpha-D-glucosyltransferase n=1 Tax=Pseudoduganella namucuonensis TaxID=1035707 RepID=A0A1I7FJ77_9BURK|nr:TIM-barrel domain-containing protein [Pseudoduganella namucuonensis]SFU36106.1 alpha-glucosidase/oligosaccharide 4-alpha-D-glucosyltransferase [Pseudoduganella namucuonensis]
MTPPTLAKIALLLLASPLALAQNADRKLQSAALNGKQLEITTSDGKYVIKPYSSRIMETTFIPRGERHDAASHAVVLAPDQEPATLRDEGGALQYGTAGITVTVTKSPFRIAYAYKGAPLVAEKLGHHKKDGAEVIDFELDKDEALYGAGARAVGFNRRGKRFTLYNKAHYGYEERSELLNFTLPVAMSSKMYALHFDNAAIGHLDFDSGKNNTLAYETISGRKTYQVIAGDSWEDVVGGYTSLTGRQPLPPRWAFGNFASRFGYHTEREARDVVNKFIAEKMPLDAIVFDLYWFGKEVKGTMGNLAFDKDNFPDPKKMIADFNAQGVKTVLITEPFVLTTSGKWQEAVDKRALATDAAGKPATYDFFFGNTGLVDVYSQTGKDWFWDIYKNLRKDYGVAGWWGDLGEPEVHPSSVRHATGTADQVHNTYGHDWARLIHEGYRKDFPNERPFILMRAGYSGSQRFGLIPWSGDVNRSWGGLQSQPEIAVQMGMQGIGYMHSDLGGFAGEMLDDELYTRWLQYGVFQPVFRPHAQEAVASEPVFREEATKALARESIRLRYSLLPYNYTLGFDNNQQGLPLMRPVLYEEPKNEKVRGHVSSYLWGREFLVAPITEPGARRKEVYLPATSAWFDFHTGRRYEGGITTVVPVTLDHIPVFVRAGAFIPMVKPVQSTSQYNTRSLDLHYYHDASVTAGGGKLYDDDGATPEAFEKGQYELVRFASALQGKELSITINSEVGKQYQRPERGVALIVHNVAAKPARVQVEGRAVKFGWDAKTRLLSVPVAATKRAVSTVVITLQ